MQGPDLLDQLPDPDALLELVAKANESAAKAEERWCVKCRALLGSKAGKAWFKEAITRYNLLGSVFATSTDPVRASHADGRRHVLSDILNSAAAGRRAEGGEDE